MQLINIRSMTLSNWGSVEDLPFLISFSSMPLNVLQISGTFNDKILKNPTGRHCSKSYDQRLLN